MEHQVATLSSIIKGGSVQRMKRKDTGSGKGDGSVSRRIMPWQSLYGSAGLRASTKSILHAIYLSNFLDERKTELRSEYHLTCDTCLDRRRKSETCLGRSESYQVSRY
jgi:hypothetical protein